MPGQSVECKGHKCNISTKMPVKCHIIRPSRSNRPTWHFQNGTQSWVLSLKVAPYQTLLKDTPDQAYNKECTPKQNHTISLIRQSLHFPNKMSQCIKGWDPKVLFWKAWPLISWILGHMRIIHPGCWILAQAWEFSGKLVPHSVDFQD